MSYDGSTLTVYKSVYKPGPENALCRLQQAGDPSAQPAKLSTCASWCGGSCRWPTGLFEPARIQPPAIKRSELGYLIGPRGTSEILVPSSKNPGSFFWRPHHRVAAHGERRPTVRPNYHSDGPCRMGDVPCLLSDRSCRPTKIRTGEIGRG
jgi:hypothetical protein